MFGYCVKVWYKDVFKKHGVLLEELKVDVNNGLGDVYKKIKGHPKEAEVKADIEAVYLKRPELAYVNISDKENKITNLHAPNDVIVDASMAAALRWGGVMQNKNGDFVDSKFVIPDRTYAEIYDVFIGDCKEKGKLDPAKIGI